MRTSSRRCLTCTKIGKTITTTVLPGGTGTPVDLGSKANFDFQGQSWMPINATLHAGDVIRTRCVWNNPTAEFVTFGEKTENEMCFSFTMYYPRVSLPSRATPSIVSTCQ